MPPLSRIPSHTTSDFQIDRNGGFRVAVLNDYFDRLVIDPSDQQFVERVTGIEPALSAWEAEVLPLNYTRVAAGTAPIMLPARKRVVSWPCF